MNRFAARAFLAASAAALVLYPFASSIESGVYEGFGLATLGLTVLAIVAYRPANAHGWGVMAAAVFLFACGDIAYGFDGSFPGAADAFYAPAYAAWIIAVWILIRRERF